MASSMLTAEVSASSSTEAEVDKALKASLLSCANDPDFAVICDFLQKFSNDLGLDLPNFKLLLQWLTKTDEVSPQLRDMQIKLLRKTRKTVHEKSWESALSKFCFTYSAQDGWEIERFGYKNSSVKVKLRILRELLECQFERNTKFRSKILTLSADSLRSKPIGRDRQGHAYWVTQDNDCNIRIYQEHLDEEIWHVVATNRDEFVTLLKRLKGSEVVHPCEDIDVVDEDTSSSSVSRIDSCSVQKDLGPGEKFDSQEDEQKIPKLSIKIAIGRNCTETTNTKYLGKGEEELAAEEDAKLLKKTPLNAITSCEDEFEEIEEECEDDSGSAGESEDEIIDGEKNLISNNNKHKLQNNFESKETNKKVEPLLISQNKILSNDSSVPSINGCKKRNLDRKDSDLYPQIENQEELNKFRSSLLHSKRSKFTDKNEEDNKVIESKESSEEIYEEEADEEDIDSAAAEEDENEEKLFVDYESEDEAELGEEISDPVIKIVGEGSGKECNVENNLYCIDYDLDSFVSPSLDDIIVEDFRYVYGEGNGDECLVGNEEDNKVIESKESSEEIYEEEADEEDIDSAAAEEDENEEKLFVDYESEDEAELGEEISDPVIKIVGEGSGKECNVENNLYCIDYDLDSFVSPSLDDIIVEDFRYVYGEGNGDECLVGNEEDNKVIESKESSEEIYEEEADEEDIDSAAAEEDENEEKLFVDYESEDEAELGEEISDPVIKIVGEGSGKECNVENNLYCIDYDLDSFVSPSLDDIIVEDFRYVYGEGNGDECLVGNVNVEKDTEYIEKNAALSITSAEIDVESQQGIEIQKKENKNLQQPNNKLSEIIKPVTDNDIKKETEKSLDEIENSKKNIDNNTEKLTESSTDTVEQLNDANLENISKDTLPEHDLTHNKIAENRVLSISRNSVDEKDLKTSCKVDSQNSNDHIKVSTPQDATIQQTHANKMSALESLKKELRESKQKLLEKKSPQTTEKASAKVSCTSICNRKRRFTDQTEEISSRPTNSESDVDLNSENNEDISNEKEIEIDEREKDDVGGKRLKMRPKQTNFELRKKIEAQKIATKEEATSSSGGEEGLKKQKKMVDVAKTTTEFSKNDNNPAKYIKSESIASNKKVGPTKPSKVKPTLAEIIEKKLKRTADKKRTDSPLSDKDNTKEVAIPQYTFSSLNKSPITKPLKKNVLIQIRQEVKDDEVPRKRCNSQDLNQTALSDATKSICPTIKDVDEKSIFTKTDSEKQKSTLERHRKRRSSEESVQIDSPKEPEAKKEVTAIEETGSLKRDKPNDAIREEVKDGLKDVSPQTDTLLPVSGRRSGRRSGTIPNYIEASLPKKNRGSIKNSKELTKSEKMDPKKYQTQEKLDVFMTDAKSDDNKNNEDKKRFGRAATPPNKNDVKATKTETNTDSVEKIVISQKVKSSSTVKTAVKGTRKQREVDTTNIIDVDSETPIRQSRRIAQQKIREEAERRKLEEIALRTMKQELKKKKKAEKQTDPAIVPPTEPSSESEENDVEIKKKSQKKKFPGRNGNWSSGSEEQEEPEEEDEEPHHYETDPGSPLFKSDHEFSPESDIEDESQVVPMKRARTVRKEDADVDGATINNEEACQKCNKSDHPEWILLCDNCDKGYHCSCLSPVLFYIPEGNWYCPPCQQEQLIKSLEDQLKEFDELVEKKKKKEENEKRIAEEEKARQEEEAEKSKCKTKQDKKISTKKYNNNSSSEDHSQEGDDDDDEDSITNSDDSKKSDLKNKSKQKHRSKNIKNSDKRHQRDRRSKSSRNRRNRYIHPETDSEIDSHHYSEKSNSASKSNTSSSSTYTESDNEPIYKLRKRRQINVSYRINEYDDLINSALKKEMDEVAGAGNLGRGKDISTIIEADKEEKARQKQIHEGDQKESNHDQEKQQGPLGTKLNDTDKDGMKDKIKQDESDSDAEPIIRKFNVKPSQKKKSRKLTTLDISSEDDDGSDEDFKGSSIDDEEEDEDTSISASNSDSSLEIYKKHGRFKKKRRKAARRAFRERRRNRKFLVDESDDEDVKRPKSKKKRKDESDYTESEADDDDISDLSENIDSADLCDDTTTDESDGAWRPNKRKKAKKSTNVTEQKSAKLKNSSIKKAKKVEYSDDDVSDSEEEDDDEEVCGSGKGYGKQPRSQPLKKSSAYTTKTKGKGKERPDSKARNSKKSSGDESSQSNSEDSTRRTRGRRYAYIEDFDDDSSDGGIKPGVQRPDTPPEEREKFIKRQEEIKRMLAEKNAEGAILAATPRLTPIKTDGEKDKKSPAKAGVDSLSTVPLSVIRQAKVLDIDYLQRRGENLDDLSNEVGDVDEDFDDADLPDDLPEDMDEDAIARMVEEEEEFVVAAAKDLPTPDDVLRTSNLAKQIKTKEGERHIPTENSSSFSETTDKIVSVNLPAPSSNLQEPIRKRLPMPTIHPPLLRHQYLMHDSMTNSHHMMQRQGGPPSHLLQNALSAPLSQPLDRSYPSPHHSANRIVHSIPLQSTVTPGLNVTRPSHPASSLGNTKQSTLLDRPPQERSTNPQTITENKPRGRRKKITPLRDTLQKQQTAAAVTAATATSSALCSSLLKNSDPLLSSIMKSGLTQKLHVQPNVISNVHPTTHSPACRPAVPMPPIGVPFVGAEGPRFCDLLGSRTPQSNIQRHRGPSQMPASLLPPPPASRSSYGPPPPLKGSNAGPPPVPSSLNTSGPLRNPIQHIPQQYLGMPPNARHASHLNMFRPSIYGNPNFGPRPSLRPPNILAQEFSSGSRAYPPYGFYPPPPPLTTPGQRHAPGLASTSRTPTQIPTVQSNISHSSTSVIVSSKSSSSPSIAPKHASAPIAEITNSDSSPKAMPVKKELPIKTSPSQSSSPTLAALQTEKTDAMALSVTGPRKKLTTLQAYSPETSKKSPVLPVSDSSGSRSPPNSSTVVNHDSSSVGTLEITATADHTTNKEDKSSEFSGLVSYFSSQHDDYNT